MIFGNLSFEDLYFLLLTSFSNIYVLPSQKHLWCVVQQTNVKLFPLKLSFDWLLVGELVSGWVGGGNRNTSLSRGVQDTVLKPYFASHLAEI